MNTIDNTQDVIDSRDVIECIKELESEESDIQEAIESAETDEEIKTAQDWLETFDDFFHHKITPGYGNEFKSVHTNKFFGCKSCHI